jgi:N-acetylmuramoyl-L-alanine amidase
MGSIWLPHLPEIVADAGLPWRTWQGWETRSRSTGGYDDILAIGVHHSASSASPDNDCSYIWNNASDRPIGAVLLDRTGMVTIGAAGATNTQGKGGPLSCSRGIIPLDSGNKYMFSIEAANNGVGEQWPTVQQENYVILCAALCDAFALDPGQDVIAHFEWTDRKIDPAGNSRYANGSAEWDMRQFRTDVIDVRPQPPTPPTPIPTPEDEVTTVLILDDVRPPHARWRVDGNTKTWVRDGDASAQVSLRLAESNGGTVPSPVDGFTYKYLQHGSDDVIASYGPIVGPVPSGFDDYGRLR